MAVPIPAPENPMSPRRPLGLLALLLAAPALLAGTQDLVRTSKGHLATEVELDGHGKVLFVVDTAASASAIYAPARARFGLEADPALRITLQGAGGAQTIDRFRLPPLQIAGRRFDDLVVAGLPSGVKHGDEVMGILGQDVLARHVVELDIPEQRITLHPAGQTPASARGWTEVPAGRIEGPGFTTVSVRLAGQPVRAVLDTGARRSFINWAAARAAGVTPQTPGLLRAETRGGATQHGFAYDRFRFDAVALEPLAPAAVELAIGDLPVFGALGMAAAPAMILGLDVLGERRIVLDAAGGRLLVERAAVAPEGDA
jgi:predicted aspartyl protease